MSDDDELDEQTTSAIHHDWPEFEGPHHDGPRGDFPEHPPLSDVYSGPLTAEQALELAEEHLEEWRHEHGD